MSTIMPKGENIRRAVKWIADERLEDAGKDLKKLVNDAAFKFNLAPNEQEFLFNFYKDQT